MADAVKVIDEVLSIPATLPCPVHLEPGLKFGKGVPTRLVLGALRRRADHYAELDAMTPEQRAEHDAGIEAIKAMLPKPAQPDIEMLASALTNAPLAPSDSQGKPRAPENCVTAEHRRVIEMLLNVCGAAFELADDRFDGVAHNALADARHQAKYVSAIWQKLIPTTSNS
ncbi:TPA: hypothetical protein ACF6GQ_004540 [Citrobacter freundii]